MNQQQELEKYFKQIKVLFPAYGSYEKRFFEDFKASVTEYTLLHSDYTLQEIEENFGDPKSIISTYLSSVDSSYMYKQIKRTKLVRRGVICSVIIILMACLVYLAFDYSDYKKSTNAIIHKEKSTIYYEN